MALIASGFVLALRGIIGLGSNAGPLETVLMFGGAAALVVLGWMAWDHAPAHRSPPA
jgi:arginine exporter protein ArgO